MVAFSSVTILTLEVLQSLWNKITERRHSHRFCCCTDSTICTVCAVCALTHKEKRTTVMVLKKERMKGAMLGARVEAI